MMEKYVYVPKWLRKEIKPITRDFPKRLNVLVFDTETHSKETGRAYLLTFYNGEKVKYYWIDEKDEIELSVQLGDKKPKTIKVSKVLLKFVEYLRENVKDKKNYTHLLYAHNLEWDLGAVFDNLFPILFEGGSNLQPTYTYEHEGIEYFKIKFYGHKQWWGKIWIGYKDSKRKVIIRVIDTYNFIQKSLYRISRDLNLTYAKPSRPQLIGEGRIPKTRLEKDEVLRYCKPEILATYDFAMWILNIHKEFNVPVSVSIADLASKIFRKHFLPYPLPQAPRNDKKMYFYKDKDENEFLSERTDLNNDRVMTKTKRFDKDKGRVVIEPCQKYVIQYGVMSLAEKSYHGGRGSSFMGELCEVIGVNYYDYNSFYPYAMENLPKISLGNWKEVNYFSQEYEGFYQVTGIVKKCKYPIIIPCSDRFEFVGQEKDERIINAPLASYEIREALRTEELVIEEIKGFIWVPDKDAINPFKNYVEHFYKLKKENEDNVTKRWAYKYLLNPLYGKNIQTNPFPEYVNQPDYKYNEETNSLIPLKKRFKAGVMYLPHIASWITSLCRAKLHEDLHKYNALCCSTDSIMTKEHIESSNELGSLKLVTVKQNIGDKIVGEIPCQNGLLLYIRPKCYVYFSEQVKNDVEKIGSLRKYLKRMNLNYNSPELKYELEGIQYALHGFRGTVKDLLRMYKDEDPEYYYKHFWKVRESIIQKKPEKTRVVETRKQRLNIDWSKERMFCGLTPEKAQETLELCIYPNCFQCAYGVEI